MNMYIDRYIYIYIYIHIDIDTCIYTYGINIHRSRGFGRRNEHATSYIHGAVETGFL